MTDEATLSGWHRDPSGRHELRFWDGTRWTEHVLDEGIPGLDHPTRSGRPAVDATPTPTPSPPASEDPARLIDLAAEAGADAEAEATADEPDAAEPSAAAQDRPGEGEEGPGPARARPGSVRAATPSPVAPPAPTRAAPADPPPAHRVEPVAAESRPATGEVEPVEPAAELAAAADRADGDLAEADATPAASADHADADAAEAAEAADARPSTPRVPRELPRLAEPRLMADPPSVASPAGNSAGSTTSAIGDPHRHTPRDPTSPRVGGVVPAPAKRYRPGSPPPSPHVGPRALPAAAAVGTPITPWYRKPAGWVAMLVVVVIVAATVVLVTMLGDGSGSDRLGARPPAAAPRGTKVIENNGVAIAANKNWIVASDPGNTFPLLRQTDWGEPLAAIAPGGTQALVVAPLHDLEHQPEVDPELFWSDQIGTTSGMDRTEIVSFSVHGYRANRVSLSGDGVDIEAAAIDTGDAAYLVAVRGPTPATAQAEFERVIQTFDLR